MESWECVWFLTLIATFFLLLVWLYFWVEARNDFNEFNWSLYNRSGEWNDGTITVLAMTAAGFTYTAFLMVLALGHIAVGQQLNLHWIHKVGVTAALLTTVVGMISVSQTWGEEWDIIAISLQATGPFLHIGAVIAATALAWLIAGQVARTERMCFQAALLLFYAGTLLTLYLVPLAIKSPCIMNRGDLKTRPDIIGHQGAPMLAPENTMMAFQKAVQLKVSGLQTDVAISVDGVPFLLRDRTLRRTTNVNQVFPDRQFDAASMFNWTDLQALNAGQWFIKDNPFWTVGSLSKGDLVRAENQSLCSLEDFLELAAVSNCSVVFRLRRPPPGHPHHMSWINDTLETVLSSGIQQKLVMWTPDSDRKLVREVAPGFQQTSTQKQSPAAARQRSISRLLLRYNRASAQDVRYVFRRAINHTTRLRRSEICQTRCLVAEELITGLKEEGEALFTHNVSLTLYTVNKPWLYSVLWCTGVPSVSSDAPHILNKVPYPIWLMTPDEYCLSWVITDLVSIITVVGIFVFQNYHMIRWRMSGIRSYNPEQIMLSAAVRRSSRDVNIMKEKLIFSEVSNGVGSMEELYGGNGYDRYTNDGVAH